MWKTRLEAFRISFSDIFNTRDDMAKGRTINLTCTLLAAFYNVFITGIFYTGFLSMYGISITGVGIITFIPYIANLTTIFSSKLISRFDKKRRKYWLVASKIYFYFMYIVATTLMPQFVTDPGARLIWFAVILFMAYAVYAMFSPGITVWFYQFFPKDNERRTRYLLLCQVFSSIMSTCILLFSGILTDAIAGSPFQNTLILGFRYLAFALVVTETIVQLRAKDFSPEDDGRKMRLSDAFTVPFKHRKFLMCMIMMFCWNYIANLNNGLWNYHLLNHMHFKYTLINLISAMYTVILLVLSGPWRRVLRRFSWIKTFGIACLLWVPTEVAFFFMTPERAFMFVPVCFVQNVLSVGLNLSYANILYMNLPEENSTACIAFNIIGCNICAFLGLLTGTAVSSITGDNTVAMLGMDVYAVQFTTLMRGVTILAMGVILFTRWRAFTREDDITAVEQMAEEAKRAKALRAAQPRLTLGQAVRRIASRLKNRGAA